MAPLHALIKVGNSGRLLEDSSEHSGVEYLERYTRMSLHRASCEAAERICATLAL